MRLHPIAALNMRYASRDTVLPVGGGSDGSSPALVKKGSKFIAGFDAMYRDPKIWGSDADEFIPERWIDRPQPPHWAYVPFSG
jgi:cytochrome P450